MVQTLIVHADKLLLWSNTISKPVRCCRPYNRQEDYLRKLAIRLVQLVRRWSASWPLDQRLYSRQIWLSTDNDVLHGLDDRGTLHPGIRAFSPSPCFRRSHVWYPVGCFSGISILITASIRADLLQTLSTTYACEVVPTVLRPYLTAYVCMCWGAGILLSSGVVRAVAGIDGNLAWKLPFACQFIWPVPLFIGAYFAPESPWNAVRRGKFDLARKSLQRLRGASSEHDKGVEATLAYIRYTTDLEKSETEGATFLDCFRGTNLRRTEIVSQISGL